MNIFFSFLNNKKLIKRFSLFAVAIILFITVLVVIKNNDESKILIKEESDFGPVWIFEKTGKRCMSFIEPPTPIV